MKRVQLFFIGILMPFFLSAQSDLKKADNAFASQQFSTAIQFYKSALVDKKSSKADKGRIAYDIAECYRIMGDWLQAEVYYEKAQKLKYPDDHLVLHLAEMQQMKGDYAAALDNFKNYTQLVPSDPAGDAGVQACTLAAQWQQSGSRWQVTNEAQLNTKFNDFCPMWLDRKHNGLVITSKRPGQSGSDIDPLSGYLYSDMFDTRVSKNGQWSTPLPTQGDANVPNANDGSCSITHNGNHMFFTRCDQKKKQFVTCKIFYAEKQGNKWGTPVMIDFGLNAATLDSFNFRHPAVSMNEDVMVFSSDMSGTTGGSKSDLWVSCYDKKTKTWGKPVNMGTTINTSGREGFPYIADDGTLYFSSDGHPGMGGLDIYKAPLTDAKNWKWGTPVNMKAPINSSADDFGIIFDGNKQRGYFSSNRDGTKGADDIWSFYKCPLTVAGVVKDCEKDIPVVNAKVQLTGSDGSEVFVYTDATGGYKFKLNDDVAYVLNVIADPSTNKSQAQAYFSLDADKRGKISTVDVNTCEQFQMDFCLKPIPQKIAIAFPAVLYDLDKATLRPESKDSLNYLYQLLMDNPSLVIELDAHTDSRASDKHNMVLSQARAQSCVDYLISKGIAPARLVAKGWGESRPLKLPNGIVLSEKYILSQPKALQDSLFQLNRRTVFQVVSWDYVDPNSTTKPTTQPVNVKKGFYDNSDSTDDVMEDVVIPITPKKDDQPAKQVVPKQSSQQNSPIKND